MEIMQTVLPGVPTPANEKSNQTKKGSVSYKRTWILTPEDGSVPDEDAQVVFEGLEDAVDYAAFRAATDQWLEVDENLLHAIGLSPIEAATGGCTNLVTNARGIVRTLPDIDPERPINEAAIREGRLFLVVPQDTGFIALPCRYTATQSVMESDGLGCKMTLLRQRTKDGDPLPPAIRAEIFNKVRDYRRNKAVILIREGAIGYVGTSYAPLCPYEGITAFLAAITEDHPDREFVSGRASHDAMVSEFDLKDGLLDVQFAEAFKSLGEGDCEAHCCAAFMSSEVGRWAMTARAYVRVKKESGETVTFPLPYPARVDHRGKKTSIADWKEAMTSFAASFKDAVEAIEKMGNTPIEAPGTVLRRLREQYTILPADAVKTKAAALDAAFPNGGGMAVDVYAAAAELVNVDGAGNVQAFLERSEELAKMCLLPWQDIDAGKKWKKPR